jgi:hypothetical protein
MPKDEEDVRVNREWLTEVSQSVQALQELMRCFRAQLMELQSAAAALACRQEVTAYRILNVQPDCTTRPQLTAAWQNARRRAQEGRSGSDADVDVGEIDAAFSALSALIGEGGEDA